MADLVVETVERPLPEAAAREEEEFETLDEIIKKAVIEHVTKVYKARRSVTETAKIIGRNRTELYRLFKRYDIDLERLRQA